MAATFILADFESASIERTSPYKTFADLELEKGYMYRISKTNTFEGQQKRGDSLLDFFPDIFNKNDMSLKNGDNGPTLAQFITHWDSTESPFRGNWSKWVQNNLEDYYTIGIKNWSDIMKENLDMNEILTLDQAKTYHGIIFEKLFDLSSDSIKSKWKTKVEDTIKEARNPLNLKDIDIIIKFQVKNDSNVTNQYNAETVTNNSKNTTTFYIWLQIHS